nr:hypothetical protein TC0128 [imported] - Chlamydia muridarum (strain Nigg) [Chlamydia muridarum]
MFQFSRCCFAYLCIQYTMVDYYSTGFPHSDTSGSLLITSSPELFAGIRVLHRLSMPRHPPIALINLVCKFHRSMQVLHLKTNTLKRLLLCVNYTCYHDYFFTITYLITNCMFRPLRATLTTQMK